MFDDVFKAAKAVQAISQAWLFPANVRLLDSREAFNNGFGDGRQSVVVLAFENADHPVDAWMDRALAITKDFGGSFDPDVAKSGSGHRAGAAEAWRRLYPHAALPEDHRGDGYHRRYVRDRDHLGSVPRVLQGHSFGN